MCPNCGLKGDVIAEVAKTIPEPLIGDVLDIDCDGKKSSALPVEIDSRKFAVLPLEKVLGASQLQLWHNGVPVVWSVPELAEDAPIVRRIAPTAKNQQQFHIYVLQSKEALAKVNELTRCAYEAPVVFIVCYDKSKAWVSPFDASDNSGVMDTSIVGTHMMLEAFGEASSGGVRHSRQSYAVVFARYRLPVERYRTFQDAFREARGQGLYYIQVTSRE